MLGTIILEERESKYNGHLRVVRSWGLGTYIQADGLTQSGGVVETFWRQTIKKLKNSKIPRIQNVLILGLGGGTVAKLIRKYWKDARITGVDIDPSIVELGEKYLGLNRNEIKIEIEDALEIDKRLKVKGKKYDLIIVDLYNGDQFPEKFATENYIHLVRLILSRSGIAVFNRLYYKGKKIETEKFGEKLRKIFKKVEYYHPVTNLMLICTN